MGKFKLHKCVPNAKFDQYYIIWFNDVPENCKEGFVGVIRNSTNENIEIKIEIDNDYMIESNNRTCCLWINVDDYYKSEVVLSSAFFEVLRNNPEIIASIWHEVGHFHTLHYFDSYFIDGSINKYRTELFEKGEVTPEEEAADLFELYYSEDEDTIKNFNWLIKRRRLDPLEPDGPYKDKAVRELCKRKRMITGYENSEELIIKRLCEICGVSDVNEL